jgi:hypothetical protein
MTLRLEAAQARRADGMTCCAVGTCTSPTCDICTRVVPWIRQQEATAIAAKQARLERELAARLAKKAARKA